MNRKIKNLIILILIFLVITSIGAYYTFSVQGEVLEEKTVKYDKLMEDYASVKVIKTKLAEIEQRVLKIDSVLFTGKFIIPQNLSQSQFFDFVDFYSEDDASSTYTNTKFEGMNAELGINYYIYQVKGRMTYNEVYKLIYAIEHSKELKKVVRANLKGINKVDQKGGANYLIEFDLEVRVYHSPNDQFASMNLEENDLSTEILKDAYYPIVKVTVKPNQNRLPDIQDGALISLIPQGAYISDSNGNSRLMEKGDKVYLGHLEDINYEDQTVTFVLNKGGFIERQTMKLGENFRQKGK